jgi:succinate-semialdehyde dehydrogenase/glutarate-semialdehyde dehydrogenase
MKVCNLDVYRPIAPVITAKDEDEAVIIANSTEFGLGAEIWFGDLNRAERVTKRIQLGFIAINGMVKSDPRLPLAELRSLELGWSFPAMGSRNL